MNVIYGEKHHSLIEHMFSDHLLSVQYRFEHWKYDSEKGRHKFPPSYPERKKKKGERNERKKEGGGRERERKTEREKKTLLTERKHSLIFPQVLYHDFLFPNPPSFLPSYFLTLKHFTGLK